MLPITKLNFCDEFVKLYLSMGFGNLPKREIDLFVFNFLTSLSEYSDKSNYELANAFRVPESRIKTLRLNAALRYEKPAPAATLAKIVQRLVRSEQSIELVSEKFEILLENPVEKWEMENFLKQHKRPAEYTLHSEILRISPRMLLELIVTQANLDEKQFKKIISKSISSADRDKKILEGSESFKQTLEKIGQHFSIDTIISILINLLDFI